MGVEAPLNPADPTSIRDVPGPPPCVHCLRPDRRPRPLGEQETPERGRPEQDVGRAVVTKLSFILGQQEAEVHVVVAVDDVQERPGRHLG